MKLVEAVQSEYGCVYLCARNSSKAQQLNSPIFHNYFVSNSLPKGDAFSFHLQLNGGAFAHINHLTEEYKQT